MNILFQEPFAPRNVRYGKFEKGAGNNTFHYGLACIASYIKDRGYNVSYLDPNIHNMSVEEYIKYIKDRHLNLIGISSTTLEIDYVIETTKIIKKYRPDIIIVLGGVHPTLMPHETMKAAPTVDYIIIGEGEKPFYRLVKALGDKEDIEHIDGLCYRRSGEIISNPPVDNRLTPEEIPIPLFEIFPMREYIAQITFAKVFPSYSIIASRGCPFRCTFCNSNDVLGKKVRYKPVDTLIKEIKILKENYGMKGIMFLDSTFTLNKNWVKEFCDKYKASGLKLPWACNTRVDTLNKELLLIMKGAGCWGLAMGIESGNQKSLDILKKGVTVLQNTNAVKLCLELGFFVYTTYIICLPSETKEDALNTIEYARKMGNHLSMFYLPVPFPKTELEALCRAEGGLRTDVKWRDYNSWDFSNPVYINPLIGKGDMQRLLKTAYIRFYSNPIVIYRNFKEVIQFKQSYKKYIMASKSFLSFLNK